MSKTVRTTAKNYVKCDLIKVKVAMPKPELQISNKSQQAVMTSIFYWAITFSHIA
jgi:hypothetical protein